VIDDSSSIDTKYGHEIHTAKNMAEARTYYNTAVPFDLIILDVGVLNKQQPRPPDMNALFPGVRILLTSDSYHPELNEIEFLSKPFVIEDILDKVKKKG
jgi:hypothetical protein